MSNRKLRKIGLLLLIAGTFFKVVGQTSWQENLPECPCVQPSIEITDDGWAVDKGNISYYHPGSEICFRSYPVTLTEEGKSGQQCCYYKEKLITSGSAAGTPDKSATCKGETQEGLMKVRWFGVWGHIRKDVKPWKEKGWEEYNQIWKPNKGADCESLKISK